MVRNRSFARRCSCSIVSIVLGAAALAVAPAIADTFEWANPFSGEFDGAGNWNLISGTGPAPPGAGDTADFNELGIYTVTVTDDATLFDLNLLAGNVLFTADHSSPVAFDITDDVLITGSVSFALIDSFDDENDINMSITDNFVVHGGAFVTFSGGSTVTARDLFFGTDSGDASVVVDGAGSALNRTGTTFNANNIAQGGATASLVFQNGATGDLDGALLVGVSGVNGTDGTLNVFSGANVELDDVEVATLTSTAIGRIELSSTGATSKITQTGNSTLIIGSASGGAGTVDVGDGGVFNTGAGTTTIKSTGSISITTSGTFNANGDLMVDGGDIMSPVFAGTLNLAPNITLTATNGGRVRRIDLIVDDGAAIDVNNGGDILLSKDGGLLSVGQGSTGTVLVDGAGSNLESSFFFIGAAGGSSVVTLQNNALGTFGSLGAGELSLAAGSNSQVELNVLSGSDLKVRGSTSIGTASGVGASAMVVIDGAGSRLESFDTVVGRISNGVATVDVQNGATISGGSLRINQTGTVNIGVVGAGALVVGVNFGEPAVINGGQLEFGSQGVLSLHADGTFTVQNNGSVNMASSYVIDENTLFDIKGGGTFTLQEDLDVDDGSLVITDLGTVAVAGALTTTSASSVTLGGGSLVTQSLNISPGGTFNFNFGKLNITSDLDIAPSDSLQTALGGSHTISFGQVLQVDGTTTLEDVLTLNGGTYSTADLVNPQLLQFQQGELHLTGPSGLTIGASGPLGAAVSIGAGQRLDIANTLSVDPSATLSLTTGGNISADSIFNNGQIGGTGTLAGRLHNNPNSELQGLAGNNLVLTGSNNANNGQFTLSGGQIHFTQDFFNTASGLVIGNGTLRVDGGTTNDGNMAFSATANVIGDVVNNASGLITSSGGTTTFFDDVLNNGEIRTSVNSFTVYFGSYSGNGDTGTGTVIMEGDLKPGSSPGLMAFGGDLVLGDAATTEIEIGGLAPGAEFDQIAVTAQAVLGGDLEVILISGFLPELGNTFELLTAASITGEFDHVTLPGAGYELLYTPTSVELVATSALSGDYNNDGVVDAVDYAVWRDNLGSPDGTLLNDTIGGVVGAAQYDAWRLNFGASLPLSSSLADSAAPEPSTCVLLTLFVLAMASRNHMGRL